MGRGTEAAAAAAVAAGLTAILAAACTTEVRNYYCSPGACQTGAGGTGSSSTAGSSSSTATASSSSGAGGAGAGGGAASSSSSAVSSSSSAVSSSSSGCVAESNAAFCAAQGNVCETVSGVDNCNMPRMTNCGECASPLACVSSTCKTPVCGSFANFSATGTEITSACVAGIQDIPEGMTPTGSALLVLHGDPCGGVYTAFIADETAAGSLTYTTQQITEPAGMDFSGEEQSTLTADGLTIIATNTAHTGFVASSRSALGKNDFGAVNGADYVNLAAVGTQTLGYVYISPDGLALYYSIANATNTNLNGIYEALRASTSVPFQAGVMMDAAVQAEHDVTATSVDRMTLFLQTNNFSTVVLTRTSLDQPFVNPNAPNAPPTAPGFRTRPLQNCNTLVGSCNGGCSNEKICTYN
jgi:hypothetical protein